MKILIINGSHRKGNTDIAIHKIKEEICKTNNTVEVLNLKNIEIKLPDGCEICAESGICPNIKDEFSEKIEPTIRNYDTYIIATPIWSDGVTPLTKIFWDRIVSWCHKDRMYLKGKKLAIVAHGMADENSWDLAINWIKGVCAWEESLFAGSFKFKSSSKIGGIQIDEEKLSLFINHIAKS
jgi:multimeric flavodoxin WrbA